MGGWEAEDRGRSLSFHAHPPTPASRQPVDLAHVGFHAREVHVDEGQAAFGAEDLDGFEDLLISSGSLYDVMDRDAAALARQQQSAGADPRTRSGERVLLFLRLIRGS